MNLFDNRIGSSPVSQQPIAMSVTWQQPARPQSLFDQYFGGMFTPGGQGFGFGSIGSYCSQHWQMGNLQRQRHHLQREVHGLHRQQHGLQAQQQCLLEQQNDLKQWQDLTKQVADLTEANRHLRKHSHRHHAQIEANTTRINADKTLLAQIEGRLREHGVMNLTGQKASDELAFVGNRLADVDSSLEAVNGRLQMVGDDLEGVNDALSNLNGVSQPSGWFGGYMSGLLQFGGRMLGGYF